MRTASVVVGVGSNSRWVFFLRACSLRCARLPHSTTRSLQVAGLCGHPKAAALIASLTAEDEGVHMGGRRAQEVQRQRQLVVLKQRLYGRPIVSLEGGHEFEV